MIAFITSVAGALIVAAILSALKSRWLYVIAPKLYLNTPLSSGQVISLSIYNAGLMSEEDIAVTFRPATSIELIATSKSTLIMNGRTIVIPKLSRLESVEVTLLVEGKAFESSDIETVESKATSGKVVASKEKASSFWQAMIITPLIILFFSIPFLIGTFVGAEMKQSIFAYVVDKLDAFQETKQLAGYQVSTIEKYGFGKFDGVVTSGNIKIEVVEVVRRGDVLLISTKLSNNTKSPIFAEASLKSSAGDTGTLSFRDGRVESFGIGSKESKIILQKAYLPENLSTKIIQNRFDFGNVGSDRVSAEQILGF
ncbi:hypothetical protein M3M50_00880 [Pseudomonas bijieensis]|uniref:hypothetical protein n=1 Tax=Pseudomonas bijieensis TaxID=2681983 RepID=UPI00200FDAF8|nr:hypothetical protein [Pseudomonas bijieensis]UQI31203.1 hypothetical protein M3M50_00880 [Pseudomonas bijieensis]